MLLDSFHSKKREVTATIAELSTLATRIGARSLAGRVETELVHKLEADHFHLVVVGEFNHGKTTFVNALLGRDVLPVGVTPTTAVIHHVGYSETPEAYVVRDDESKTPLAVEAVKRFAVGGSDSDAKDVRYVELLLPSPLLKERIVLVDTPGVNDLSLQRADITYNYIPKSDAVLFLLDAGQPLKESERVFLTEKLLKQSRDKIIFVVTKRDIWEGEEEQQALDYIRGELKKLMQDAPVFAVSAERELAGEADSGMPELTSHLMRFLAEERGRILLDNALGRGLDVASLLEKGVDARRRAVQMTSEDLGRRIDILEKDLAGQAKTVEQRRGFLREEVAAIRAWVRRDLEHFSEDVIKQLPKVIDDAKADEIKLHLGPFLERTFIEWAQKETQEIGVALESLAERTVALVRDDANETAKRLSEEFGGDMKTPDVQVDTLGYDASLVALMAVGAGAFFSNMLLGGGLIVAALPLAWYLRGRIENQTRDKARELAPVAIREAAGKLGPKLEEMVTTFAERLDAWVVTAGEELHRELIEILKQAKTERDGGAAEVSATLGVCDEQSAQLVRVGASLTRLRTEVAKGATGTETAASAAAAAGTAAAASAAAAATASVATDAGEKPGETS